MTSTTATGGRIKGVAFRELLVWLEKKHGRDYLARVAADMPVAVRGPLDPEREALGTLAATWYPMATVHALLDSLTRGLSATDRSTLAREGARAVMAVTLSGIYKGLMAMFVSPQLYARFASKLWQSYYDGGEFTVVISDDGKQADCTIRDWSAHHPLACDMNIEAATCIYEAMGQKGVFTDRVACVAQGDASCRYVTRWR